MQLRRFGTMWRPFRLGPRESLNSTPGDPNPPGACRRERIDSALDNIVRSSVRSKGLTDRLEVERPHAVVSKMTSHDEITLEYRNTLAVIILNNPRKLNALTKDLYYQLATFLYEVAARDEILVTLLIGRGRFFSA